ncbi:MAG: protoporphyrinogen oxidase [Acidimicrobiales bacterium]
MSGRRSVLVVGGGVAGLVAARALSARFDVVVVEREPAAGGKLATDELRGRPLDLGPDSFLTRNGAGERLCRELGLGDELVAPATSGASVLARGRVRPLPPGLVLGVPIDLLALLRSGVIGPSAAVRAAADLVMPASPSSGDPTIADVVGRRLGRSVLETLVDPLLGGINAGDSRRLSFAATAPTLAAAVAGRRSLVAALRSRPRGAGSHPERGFGAPGGGSGSDGGSGAATGSGGPRPAFLGLGGGIASLAEHLVDDCVRRGVVVRTSTPADTLERGGEPGVPWQLRFGEEILPADGVVLAVPASSAASLLAELDPVLASECGAIPYADVVTVALAWPDAAIPPGVLERAGSGILVPRPSGRLVTAITRTSAKWPRAANAGETVLRVSAGRDGDLRPSRLDDTALVAAVRAELSAILGVTAEPLATVVRRWPSSLPQYVSGHVARVRRIEERAGGLGTVAFAGAAYGGIGIPACIESGERAAASIEVLLST